MAARENVKFLPVGSILDRYLVQELLRIFFTSLICVTSLYLIVDFFDRISAFLDTGASIWTVIRYFFYKAPLSVSRVIGFATLFSALFCLGMMARTHEITAMRSSGISVQRVALPLLVLSLFICLFTFFWNEALVPIFAHQAQTIFKTEVKRKQQQSLFGTVDIWIRGERSFINVNRFDTANNTLQGVTIFLLNRDFSLRGIVETPTARWTGRSWEAKEITSWSVSPDGKMVLEKSAALPPITETPEDLKLLARDAEEFTFFDLQKQIADMLWLLGSLCVLRFPGPQWWASTVVSRMVTQLHIRDDRIVLLYSGRVIGRRRPSPSNFGWPMHIEIQFLYSQLL